MKRTLLFASVLLVLSVTADAQTYRIAEMNSEQIRSLDKQRTVVLIPGGILEEHGPYLPSFTDGYWNEHVTRALAKAITARPGWSAVIFPTIPLGNSGANDIGGKYHFPGTYSVSFSTLRTVFLDLATELGEQGFKWVFIIHGHGAPNHNRALDQAGDYFRDAYGGHMVNLIGLMPVFSAWDGKKTEAERKEDGLVIHAGMDETSMMLFVRPDLVDPKYKAAKPQSAAKMEDLIIIARSKDWPGYFGSPRLARASAYAKGWQGASREAISTALKILGGLDERSIARLADEMKKSPPDVMLDEASLKHEEATKAQTGRMA
jgi:creatinine amidohydrolase/Fe(II)-dependent formamide hydrolase-like protein